MIATCSKPSSSSASRIQPTKPSIMPDGAMTSTPGARVADERARPRFSSEASLSTSPSWTTPQWPWSVYSQKQASGMTTSSGSAFLIARVACCTRPSSFHASEPTASFLLGDAEQDHRRDAEIGRHSCASATASSTESCNWPGMRGDRLARTPFPGTTNSG